MNAKDKIHKIWCKNKLLNVYVLEVEAAVRVANYSAKTMVSKIIVTDSMCTKVAALVLIVLKSLSEILNI